jgi:hypothetical protein
VGDDVAGISRSLSSSYSYSSSSSSSLSSSSSGGGHVEPLRLVPDGPDWRHNGWFLSSNKIARQQGDDTANKFKRAQQPLQAKQIAATAASSQQDPPLPSQHANRAPTASAGQLLSTAGVGVEAAAAAVVVVPEQHEEWIVCPVSEQCEWLYRTLPQDKEAKLMGHRNTCRFATTTLIPIRRFDLHSTLRMEFTHLIQRDILERPLTIVSPPDESLRLDNNSTRWILPKEKTLLMDAYNSCSIDRKNEIDELHKQRRVNFLRVVRSGNFICPNDGCSHRIDAARYDDCEEEREERDIAVCKHQNECKHASTSPQPNERPPLPSASAGSFRAYHRQGAGSSVESSSATEERKTNEVSEVQVEGADEAEESEEEGLGAEESKKKCSSSSDSSSSIFSASDLAIDLFHHGVSSSSSSSSSSSIGAAVARAPPQTSGTRKHTAGGGGGGSGVADAAGRFCYSCSSSTTIDTRAGASAGRGGSAVKDDADLAAGVAVADDHDDSNLVPISVNDVLYTASIFLALYDKYDHSTIHGKRVKDNLRYHFDVTINEEGFHDQHMTILVTKSEETFLRTQVYPYWRKDIDHLHALRTKNRAKNMTIAATGRSPPPPPGSVANTASGGCRNRNVSSKEVIVLLILIAYNIICTTTLTCTYNFC